MSAELRGHRVVFQELQPAVRAANVRLTDALGENSALDPKTRDLVYIAAMSASRLPDGVYTHTLQALEKGASPRECVDACLHALQVAGAQVRLYSLPQVDRAIRDFEAGERAQPH